VLVDVLTLVTYTSLLDPNVPILGVAEIILPVVNPTTEVPVIANVHGLCTGALNEGIARPYVPLNTNVPSERNVCIVYPLAEVIIPPEPDCAPRYLTIAIPLPPAPEPELHPPLGAQ
jgi:hypothetical protein